MTSETRTRTLALVIDWGAQEFGIAAELSGDHNMRCSGALNKVAALSALYNASQLTIGQ